MALSGITSVGEFHYLHHAPDGRPYAQREELAQQVIRAAREVGLRISLLRVGYARAGFKLAPNPRQARFIDKDVETFLASAQALREATQSDPLVTVGLAPHSVRAVPGEWLRAVAALSEQVVHMHVAEQPGELAACEAEHGRRPVELLEELGLLRQGFTAVHAIHLTSGELAALGRSGAKVCACPSTERNLGDGVVPADALSEAGVGLALGSDSQATIDLLEEMRQLEGHLRLWRLRRAVLDPGLGEPSGLAERLLAMATREGAQSLGQPSGTLAPGSAADFFTVDLNHLSLVGAPRSELLPALVFGAEKGAIRDVYVQGRPVVVDGRHPRHDEVVAGYLSAVERL
jgi:formimidoylglutamate deiminase